MRDVCFKFTVHFETDNEDETPRKYFWTAMENFSNEDRSKFIRFVTGRRRLPVQIIVCWQYVSAFTINRSILSVIQLLNIFINVSRTHVMCRKTFPLISCLLIDVSNYYYCKRYRLSFIFLALMHFNNDNNNNNNENLVSRHKMQMQTQQGTRFSATVKLGTKQMCLQHTLET